MGELELSSDERGVILPVRARPGARKNEIRGIQDGRLKVCVTQVAEKGKANQAILALLAKTLDLRKAQLTIVAGELSPQKKIAVQGIDAEELRRRIEGVVDERTAN